MSKHSKERRAKEGRPSVMTPEVLQKLERAFTLAFSDEMACLYAGIAEATLYAYCQANPKFSERKAILKRTPDLIAQEVIVENARTVSGAHWWAEHKMPDFMPKSTVKHEGGLTLENAEDRKEANAIASEFEQKLRDTIAAKHKKS